MKKAASFVTLDRVATTVLAVLSFVALAYIARKLLPPRQLTFEQTCTYLYAPALLLLATTASLSLGRTARIAFCFSLLVCAPFIYLFQEYSLFIEGPVPVAQRRLSQFVAAAKREGKEFDRRTALEVLREERAAGREATVPIYPYDFQDGVVSHQRDGKAAVIFGGVPLARTVYCNETGQYRISKNDEFGFSNPTGVMSQAPLEILIVGDSYAESVCLQPGETFADQIRTHHSKTASIGLSGNGPLGTFASMREFVPTLKPRVVFWIHYEGNDLWDLNREKESAVLRSYLDPGYRATQLAHWNEEKPKLAEMAEVKIAHANLRQSESTPFKSYWTSRPRFLDVAALVPLRRALHLVPDLGAGSIDTSLFSEILKKASAMVEHEGGTFFFVYMPAWETFDQGNPHVTRGPVLNAVKELKLPLIDITPVFSQTSEPMRNYVFGLRAHLTPESSRLVALALEEKLK